MISYMKPKDGPVLEGLESREVVYAKDQPQYIPLRTIVSNSEDRRVLSRWDLTPEQRKAISEGADIYLQLLTFGQPLQPILMFVGKQLEDWEKVSLGIGAEVPDALAVGK